MTEMNALAKLFYEAVKSGEKTLDEIPSCFKSSVQELLRADAKSAEEQAALIAEEQAAAIEVTKEEKKAKAKAKKKATN